MTGTVTALRPGLEVLAGRMGVRRGRRVEGESGAVPTTPVVGALVPGGALRGGAAYVVQGSTALAMAMLAGPSGEGAWCGVVGVPGFGAEAARELGVDLDRLVLVPEPGRDWLNVVAALVDALTLVLVRPPGAVSSAEGARLAARLRNRSAVLVALGSWPGAEARLVVERNTWHGLHDGHGCLHARQATVSVTGRGGAVRPRRHRLWLPAPDGSLRLVENLSAGRLATWRDEAVG